MNHVTLDPAMLECINTCTRCHDTCLGTLSHHCLEAGGAHVQPAHLRLMLACAEICRASASIMIIGSDAHRSSCRACADICERCASDCERVGEMDDCVAACRRCASSCAQMAA